MASSPAAYTSDKRVKRGALLETEMGLSNRRVVVRCTWRGRHLEQGHRRLFSIHARGGLPVPWARRVGHMGGAPAHPHQRPGAAVHRARLLRVGPIALDGTPCPRPPRDGISTTARSADPRTGRHLGRRHGCQGRDGLARIPSIYHPMTLRPRCSRDILRRVNR